MSTTSVFGSFITISSYKDFINSVTFLAKKRISSYVCFANVHMVVSAFRDPTFQKVVNEADLVAADGKPLSVYLSMFEGIRQDRICGMDIFPDLLKSAAAQGASVYFYGSTPDVLKAICEKALNEFPNLIIAGTCSPPFRTLTADERQKILYDIDRANPNLVLVSLGCPKQEKWMAENKAKIKGCMLGLGQAFNVYAGKEKRLPAWMRNLSLEWAYRLYLEPRRLWKRYLLTNSFFVFLVLKRLVDIGLGAIFPVAVQRHRYNAKNQ